VWSGQPCRGSRQAHTRLKPGQPQRMSRLDLIGWFGSALLIVSLRGRGSTPVLTPSSMVDPFYERLGFRRDPATGAWSLEL